MKESSFIRARRLVDVAFTHRRARALVWVCVLVVAAVSVPLAGAASPTSSQALGGAFSQTDGAPSTNNTTVQQENPVSADADGDISALQGWLSGRLSQTVVNCSEGLEVGNYDACDRSNGSYGKWLGDYVNVTRDSESGRNRTNAFERTSENQSEYASKVRRFRNTVEQYRQARNSSNTDRARRLARRAQRLATEVNRTDGNLTRNYRTLANGTDRNLTAATRATRNVSRDVSTTAESLSTQQFRNATITATGANREISFRDPLRVTGRVAAANGTGLANQTVGVQVDGRVRRTATTNATGVYRLTYRPKRIRLDTERVTIRYLPRNLSVYNGNETSVPVDVRQVEPTLRATGSPTAASYGDLLTVNGTLTVDGVGAGSVPVTVAADGEELLLADGTRARTAASGGFRLSTRLSKAVDAGQQTVRVSFPFEDRALARTNVSIPLTVRPTSTDLTANATQTSVNGSNVSGPVVRVTGRLTTSGGQAVSNESVTLAVNGTDTGTVSTDENGRYDANVSVPESVFAGGVGTVPVAVAARYSGTGSSLQTSNARTTLLVEVPAQPTTDYLAALQAFLVSVLDDRPWYAAVPVALAVLALGYAALRARKRSGSDDDSADGSPTGGDPSPTEATTGWDALLDAANQQLFAGDEVGAVATAYTATRRKLRDDLGLDGAYTHWEFLDAARSAVGDHRGAALGRLTELYERAAFSPYGLSETTAGTALDDAETVTADDTDDVTE